MALHDLTPQLRTRLSRMERAAGWFVLLATVLMIAGLVYYLKVMAARKGWGVQKITYHTGLLNAAGLKVGDPVKLMGRDVGEISRLVPNDPKDYYGITVEFWIKKPDYGYVWSDSTVKVTADFLGNRFLEVAKGVDGVPTVHETTNKVATGILKLDYLKEEAVRLKDAGTNASLIPYELNVAAGKREKDFYARLGEGSKYWLQSSESPAINDRLDKLANQVEAALPNILVLTNKIAAVLDDAGRAMADLGLASSNASVLLASLGPVATNLAVITDNIRDPHGSLGEWLLPTNINQQLEGTLTTANTNLPAVFDEIDRSLEALAGITSNLNAQVQANSNMLSGISKSVIDADDFVQGLKRHWLLRSAFKSKTNAPPVKK